MKKPSVGGMKNTQYLGHFAQDKYICAGHNDCSNLAGDDWKKCRADEEAKRRGEQAGEDSPVDRSKWDKFQKSLKKAL